MDTDQTKTPLNSYFEDAVTRASDDGFDLQSFVSGLDAYGILPQEVSSILTSLHASTTKEERVELIKELSAGVQRNYGGPESAAYTQFSSPNPEIQSALPVVPQSEGRRLAQEDLGEFVRFQHNQRSEYLKGNIEWRRKVARDFVERLRNDRLYKDLDADKARVKIENALESPIYAKTIDEAAQRLADKISYDELFAQNRSKAREILIEAAKEPTRDGGRASAIEPLVDIPTTLAVETISQLPTLEDVHPVLNQFASAGSPQELEAAKKRASIYASVGTKSAESVKASPEEVKEFGAGMFAIQHNEAHKKKLLEKVAADTTGKTLVESGEAEEFIKRSEKYSSKNLKNKVMEYVAPAYTPNEDFFDYVAAELRHNTSGVATPEGFSKAISHPVHFEFHMPDLSWALKGGTKQSGMVVASKVVQKKLTDRVRDLGIKTLLGLGVKAGSKILLAAPVVGWVVFIATTVLPGIWNSVKSGLGKAVAGISAGGLSPIRAASGAFSEAIQNALGTKYEDPLAANGWLLAFGVAVLPFLLAFFITTTTMHVQRSSFLPVGVEGGLTDDNQQQAFNITITAVPVVGPGGIPSSITYTVTISSLDGGQLTISDLTVSFTVFGGSGSTPATQNISGAQVAGGSYSFSVPVGASYNNSLITATANATVDTSTQAGVSGSATVSTVIGTPPTGCFVFGEAGQADAYGHTSSAWDDKSKVLTAIGILSASPELLAKYVCPYGPVTLYRVKADFGGGSVSGANSMFLYNVCVTGSQACMTYTFAHEIGHIINNRPGSTMSEFHNQGLYNREGPLWTYPNTLTESEDYAETLGDYVVWKYYSWGSRHGHAGRLNYPADYPLHYQFAKNMFKIEY